jgi:hypothetical protein
MQKKKHVCVGCLCFTVNLRANSHEHSESKNARTVKTILSFLTSEPIQYFSPPSSNVNTLGLSPKVFEVVEAIAAD